MDWSNLAFLIPALSAPFYIVAGIIMIKYPPRNINNSYGYRTRNSIASQQRWDFAQAYSSRQMAIWGGLMLIMAFLASFINAKAGIQFLIGMAILLIFTGIPVAMTEKKLKKRFQFGNVPPHKAGNHDGSI